MLNKVFPRQVENHYDGSPIALWVFALLDDFTTNGADSVVLLFAL